MNIVYLYKEYTDDLSYGEEIIEVYETEDDAKARLKDRIETGYGVPFEDFPKKVCMKEGDIFSDTYVSVSGVYSTSFWEVFPAEVLRRH